MTKATRPGSDSGDRVHTFGGRHRGARALGSGVNAENATAERYPAMRHAVVVVALAALLSCSEAPSELVGRIAQIGLMDCFEASTVDAQGRPLCVSRRRSRS